MKNWLNTFKSNRQLKKDIKLKEKEAYQKEKFKQAELVGIEKAKKELKEKERIKFKNILKIISYFGIGFLIGFFVNKILYPVNYLVLIAIILISVISIYYLRK